MAKRKKQAPRTAGAGQALILRSAESLGRLIGTLQRQLDAVATRTVRPGATPPAAAAAKKPAAQARKRVKATPAARTRAAAPRKPAQRAAPSPKAPRVKDRQRG